MIVSDTIGFGLSIFFSLYSILEDQKFAAVFFACVALCRFIERSRTNWTQDARPVLVTIKAILYGYACAAIIFAVVLSGR